MPYDISDERREWYRQVTSDALERKRRAQEGGLPQVHAVNRPRLSPEALMPQLGPSGLSSLSLFSGGGGLDVGFDRAGFAHVASYDIIDVCGHTLRRNRPQWNVFSGDQCGDVTKVEWAQYQQVDVLHGGPPCQPFSVAGRRNGSDDVRDMWPAFTDAVLTVRPRAFVAENVPGLLDAKFSEYVDSVVMRPLAPTYRIEKFALDAKDFGVPQSRTRVFFVGFTDGKAAQRFVVPEPTHGPTDSLFGQRRPLMGAREALGLPPSEADGPAPTLRSGFTGPRHSTSVLNSKASQLVWARLGIWPNGVQLSREAAASFPAENGHFRMSVQDCAVLQGFPTDWEFCGAAYQVLGQIGNSVAPPVAYAVAVAVRDALSGNRVPTL